MECANRAKPRGSLADFSCEECARSSRARSARGPGHRCRPRGGTLRALRGQERIRPLMRVVRAGLKVIAFILTSPCAENDLAILETTRIPSCRCAWTVEMRQIQSKHGCWSVERRAPALSSLCRIVASLSHHATRATERYDRWRDGSGLMPRAQARLTVLRREPLPESWRAFCEIAGGALLSGGRETRG
jgi:hypothetical protein